MTAVHLNDPMDYANRIANDAHMFNTSFLEAMYAAYWELPTVMYSDGFAQMYLGCFFE